MKSGLLAGVILAATPVQAATLDVAINDVRNANGHVLIAVCPAPVFLTPHCPFVGTAPARPGTVVGQVHGIPPGTYAVQVFHDENDNLQIDRTIIGLPKEGMGFSNDARFRFGPPDFADAAIDIGPYGGHIAITLRYF